MPTTTTVIVTNPNLYLAPEELRSTTEYKDFPRKFECLDEESIGGDAVAEVCAQGCGDEPAFAFIVEPGDVIPLQFRFQDLVNSNPEAPVFGWRSLAQPTSYWLKLQVFDLEENLVLDLPVDNIAQSWGVFHTEAGSVQNVNVNVDMLLSRLASAGYTKGCWLFRVCAVIAQPDYELADDVWADGGAPPTHGYSIGTVLVDTTANTLITLTGGGWVSLVPPDDGTYVYSAATATWYLMTAGVWVVSSGPTMSEPGEELPTQCVETYPYRLRKCDEPVVRFQSVTSGTDCMGFVHDDPTGLPQVGTGLVAYQHDFKLKGSIEEVEFPVIRELTKNRRLKAVTQSTTARLRTAGVPLPIARRVSEVLSHDTSLVGGKRWDEGDSVKRNNDDGLLWFIDCELRRQDCDRTVGCE